MADLGPKGSLYIGSGQNRLTVNIDKPRWDQSTYFGRMKHFFAITDTRNAFVSSKKLAESKALIQKYKSGAPMNDVTVDQLWRAKKLYDSAYHPDTGELMPLVGRMSMQLPMNTSISAAMFTFRTNPPAVIFWQWFNQSFNAIVNYTNRSGNNPLSTQTLIASYVCASTGAVGTALGINSLVKTMPPIVGRFVPFIAIVAANLINIPIMRNRELIEGVDVMDDNNNTLGRSKRAARRGISYVVFSRVMMVIPTMSVLPIVMDTVEKRGVLQKYPWSEMPIQTALIAVILVFAVPMCCAIFPQKMSIKVSKLEPELQASIMKMKNPPNYVFYNKGL